MERTKPSIHMASSQRPKEASNLRGLPHNEEVLTSELSNETLTTSGAVVDDTSDVPIAVMGATGTGKTTFINLASGSDLRIGDGLYSSTSIVQAAQPFTLNGRHVTLIDTPGFDDTTKSDAEILRMISAFLATTYEYGKKLAGVIYMHRISDFKMGGTSTRNFRMFRELCGESALRNVVVVTNMWSEVSEHVGTMRETQLASQDLFFKPVLAKGAKMLRHTNTPSAAHAILEHIINNRPLPLQIQRELIDEKLDLDQTAAGRELNRELHIQHEKHREEMRILQEEMQEALHEKDEQTRQELEEATRKLQEEMTRMQNDSQKLASQYSEEKKHLEKQMQEQAEEMQKEAEASKANQDEALQKLRSQLQQTKSAFADERANLTKKIEDLQKQAASPLFTALGLACDIIAGLYLHSRYGNTSSPDSVHLITQPPQRLRRGFEGYKAHPHDPSRTAYLSNEHRFASLGGSPAL